MDNLAKIIKSLGLPLFLLLSLLLLFILILGLLTIVNPVRRPVSMIRSHVLRLTPLGTDIHDIVAVIENRRAWGGTMLVNYYRGFPAPAGQGADIQIGDKSIQVRTQYWPSSMPVLGLLTVNIVNIFWGFDENGALTDVYVRKSVRVG